MNPSAPCGEKESLTERLNDARLLYAAATRELDGLSGATSDFDVAYQRAENTRVLYEAARLLHDDHLKEHGC